MFFEKYGVSILVDGEELPFFKKDDDFFLKAEKGKDYSIRVSNPTDRDVEVGLSVDGLNYMNGKLFSAEDNDDGLVLFAGQEYSFKGWRLDSRDVATFRFGLSKSAYASTQDLTDKIGLIEVYFFSGWVNRDRAKASTTVPKPDLGTEFGRREDDPVQKVGFRRDRLVEVVTICYASERSLKAGKIDLENPIVEDGCQPPENWKG